MYRILMPTIICLFFYTAHSEQPPFMPDWNKYHFMNPLLHCVRNADALTFVIRNVSPSSNVNLRNIKHAEKRTLTAVFGQFLKWMDEAVQNGDYDKLRDIQKDPSSTSPSGVKRIDTLVNLIEENLNENKRDIGPVLQKILDEMRTTYRPELDIKYFRSLVDMYHVQALIPENGEAPLIQHVENPTNILDVTIPTTESASINKLIYTQKYSPRTVSNYSIQTNTGTKSVNGTISRKVKDLPRYMMVDINNIPFNASIDVYFPDTITLTHDTLPLAEGSIPALWSQSEIGQAVYHMNSMVIQTTDTSFFAVVKHPDTWYVTENDNVNKIPSPREHYNPSKDKVFPRFIIYEKVVEKTQQERIQDLLHNLYASLQWLYSSIQIP